MTMHDESEQPNAVSQSIQGIQRAGILPEVEWFQLSKLDVDPARFQVRNHLENTYVKQLGVAADGEGLLQHLLGIVRRGLHLDPLIVWQDPTDTKGRLLVIDGHHRMEAYERCFKRKGSHVVPIQRLIPGTTEVQARAIAMAINARQHLNMTPAEIKGAIFHAMVMDEVTESVRTLEAVWGISKSTFSRMKAEARKVREGLLSQMITQAQGLNDNPQLDWEYVNANAPTWREATTWRPDVEVDRAEGLNEIAQQKLLERLHKHFKHEAKADPIGLQEVFERFLDELSQADQDDPEGEDEEKL